MKAIPQLFDNPMALRGYVEDDEKACVSLRLSVKGKHHECKQYHNTILPKVTYVMHDLLWSGSRLAERSGEIVILVR